MPSSKDREMTIETFVWVGPCRALAFALAFASALCLIGCASGGMVDKSLEAVGLKKPAVTDEATAAAALQRKRVMLRLHAGQVLNTDPAGRSLSLVVRVYRLRSTSQFMQAPYAAFAAARPDVSAFGEGVISVQEIVLTPGQRHETVETLPADTTHLAVIGLFRAPDPQRWRFVFEAKAAASNGLTIGAHACALSVATGDPVGVQVDARHLAGARCS